MKKILYSLMALVILLSFVGCDSKEKEEEYILDMMTLSGEVINDLGEIANYGYANDLNLNLSPLDYNSMLHAVNRVLERTVNFEELDVPSKYKDKHFEMAGTMYLASYAATDFMDAYAEDDHTIFLEAMEGTNFIFPYFTEFMKYLIDEKNNL